MRSNGFSIVKLPNGAYFLWTLYSGIKPPILLFATRGIRSKGKTLVIPISTIKDYNPRSIKDYVVSKGFSNVDRIFFCYDGIKDLKNFQVKSYKKELGIAFKDISKNILVFDVSSWIKANNITNRQVDWFSNVVCRMAEDKRFIIGQINDRLSLNEYRQKIVELENLLNRKEEELKNIRTVDDIQKTSIQNILRMSWIDKIETAPNNGLRILTKPMACTFVENIGRYVPIEYIKRQEILYRMMKYQALGKYFIIQPDYYVIDGNFNIRADSNNRYPVSHVRNVMIRQTYFHGQACHIGDGRACHGELAAAISGASRNGLDMLLMSFEAYLRSINLPDAAGQRYYCLPMGDADGNIEVWPYVEEVMKRENVSFGDKPRNIETYEWILNNTRLRGLDENFGKVFEGECRSWSNEDGERNMKACLELIKEREPQVYEQIMKRKEEGAVI